MLVQAGSGGSAAGASSTSNSSSSAAGGAANAPSTSSVQLQQGIDTLTSALKSNIVPDQEYLLQGSILDQHVDVLKHRLRGLCDNIDAGQVAFHEREFVYSIQGTSGQPLNLRVRCPVESGPGDCPWQLRYIGQPELDQHRATTVRSCYDIACSRNAREFLEELGCKYAKEDFF